MHKCSRLKCTKLSLDLTRHLSQTSKVEPSPTSTGCWTRSRTRRQSSSLTGRPILVTNGKIGTLTACYIRPRPRPIKTRRQRLLNSRKAKRKAMLHRLWKKWPRPSACRLTHCRTRRSQISTRLFKGGAPFLRWSILSRMPSSTTRAQKVIIHLV